MAPHERVHTHTVYKTSYGKEGENQRKEETKIKNQN